MPTPTAIGAIDVGSSAARITIARVTAEGAIRPLFYHRYPVRLGAGAFEAGGSQSVPESLIAELLEAAADMRRHLTAHHVVAVRAVATSAMREAPNGPDIARRVSEILGAPLEVIDGETEAELSRHALVQALSATGEAMPAQALLLDLGGGSLELSSPTGDVRASLTVGTVRLLSLLPALRGPLRTAALIESRAAIEQLLHGALNSSAFADRAAWQGASLVGTGGNLEVMARLLPPADKRAGIDLRRAQKLVPLIAAMPLSERQRRYHLRPERADLMLPALLIVTLIGEAFASWFIRVPSSGLRDALLHQLSLNLPPRSG